MAAMKNKAVTSAVLLEVINFLPFSFTFFEMSSTVTLMSDIISDISVRNLPWACNESETETHSAAEFCSWFAMHIFLYSSCLSLTCFRSSIILEYRKVAYDVSHFAPKKLADQTCNLCWKGIGRTPTFGVILKTNEKLIKIWNELLLVGFTETNKFDQKQFG